MIGQFWRELLMFVLGVIVGSITAYTILATDGDFGDDDEDDDDEENEEEDEE
jgi:hypothetical protein